MRLIAADLLLIPPNRQRRQFDPQLLSELAASIQANQLLNPITTRRPTEADACPEGSLILVAGERRKRAITDYLWATGEGFSFNGEPVPEGFLPCVDMGELSPLAALEAEYEENIRRTDLDWKERSAATARLADLRNAQAEARGEPPVPVSRIAEEVRGSSVGSDHTQTRDEIILAKHLDDPEIRAQTSPRNAMKVLKRKEQAARNTVLAQEVGRTLTAASHHLHNADSLEWLPHAPSEAYDVILTDQPYGMGADEFGDSAGKAAGAHSYVDDSSIFVACRQALLDHGLRIAKPQAHLYWFCDIDAFCESRDLFAAAGWWVHRTPLVWHKPGTRIPWPDHGPKRSYELILYAVKGKRPVTKVGYSDVISLPPDANLGHSAQKPVSLYTDLLRRSVRPGDSVVDPFGGSGPIIPAAHGLKCTATYVEKDPASYGTAVKRTQGLDSQLDIEDVL